MKRTERDVLLMLLITILTVLLSGCGKAENVLYVYNWGEYMADGSYGGFDSIGGFEDYYANLTGETIKVYYTTYPSNEDMYAKISGGAGTYDVIVPSDYMVDRLISEGLLRKISIEKTCAKYGAECWLGNIDDSFSGLYFDPDDEYSVPYTYGRIGIIYNSKYVDKEDLDGWNLLWNSKYSGKILQFNNSRDAFATAMYRLGYDINSTNPGEWEEAYELLLEQKTIVQSYVMDEIYNKMESEEAYIAAYYAGDYAMMKEINDNLEFYYPEETNIFVDSMCIPASSPNPEAAELFINYQLSREPAVANAEFIYYASPEAVVYTDKEYALTMGEECMDVLYPGDFSFAEELNRNAYRNLDPETLELIAGLWEQLKIEGGLPARIYIMAGIIAFVSIAALVFSALNHRRRSKYWD